MTTDNAILDGTTLVFPQPNPDIYRAFATLILNDSNAFLNEGQDNTENHIIGFAQWIVAELDIFQTMTAIPMFLSAAEEIGMSASRRGEVAERLAMWVYELTHQTGATELVVSYPDLTYQEELNEETQERLF